MKSFFLFLLSLSIIGCTSTHMTSFKDPGYYNKKIKKVLINVDDSDLETRLKLEGKFAILFSKKGIQAVESYKLFPPTREITREIILDSIETNDIDTYLIISIKGKGVETIELPSTTITKTKTSISVNNNSTLINSTSKTQEIDGGEIEKPWAKLYTRLIDAANGNIIWIADASSSGSAYTSFNDVYESYCENLLEKLADDNLIQDTEYDRIYLRNNDVITCTILDKTTDFSKIDKILINKKDGYRTWLPTKDILSISHKSSIDTTQVTTISVGINFSHNYMDNLEYDIVLKNGQLLSGKILSLFSSLKEVDKIMIEEENGYKTWISTENIKDIISLIDKNSQ